MIAISGYVKVGNKTVLRAKDPWGKLYDITLSTESIPVVGSDSWWTAMATGSTPRTKVIRAQGEYGYVSVGNSVSRNTEVLLDGVAVLAIQ
jgi:hypothetical protein